MYQLFRCHWTDWVLRATLKSVHQTRKMNKHDFAWISAMRTNNTSSPSSSCFVRREYSHNVKKKNAKKSSAQMDERFSASIYHIILKHYISSFVVTVFIWFSLLLFSFGSKFWQRTPQCTDCCPARYQRFASEYFLDLTIYDESLNNLKSEVCINW